jgi:antitoxin (DNA-binding transcriptional repressor) of toxin-antitoxin stability system
MKTVSKGKLKARMLEYFREVERSGEPLIVTDHGREVLEVRSLAPPKILTVAEALALYRAGTVQQPEVSEEELLEPLPIEDWEVLRDDDRNPW